MALPSGDFLSGLRVRVETINRDVRWLAEGLTAEQLLWRPQPGRWGVADCFEHLLVIAEAYHSRIRTALEETPASPSTTYRPRLFGRLFIKGAEPDGPVRIRARGPFVPPPPRPDAPQRFISSQVELLGFIQDAAGADLNGIRIRSPLSRFITLTLGECLEMLVVHQQRHVNQAERVEAEAGFPSQ